MKKIIFIGIIILAPNWIFGQSKTIDLNKILANLNEIKSASYCNEYSSSIPDDTLLFKKGDRFVQMQINPADTFLGVSFLYSPTNNHTAFNYCYNKDYFVDFDWKSKSVQIDTLNDNPYRPIPPFFMRAKTLIKYAINNMDSTEISYKYFQDSVEINFYFKDKIVEALHLTPFVVKMPGKTSHYVLWVDKKNNLPFKLTRNMPHETTSDVCSNLKINDKLEQIIDPIKLIPTDFSIKVKTNYRAAVKELKGQVAPDWKLKEIGGDSLSLKELKSKVLLLQFTGIGCGACHGSIPFLKELAIDNIYKDFKIISIETFSENLSKLQRYKRKNEFNYSYLVSKKKMKERYSVEAVPVFFILDENRIIRKVMSGFNPEKTKKEITETIEKLL